MEKIKIGYAPDAIKYRGLTAKRLTELGIDFVDITDINEEGLLYNDEDMYKIAEKFKREKVDGLFLPHCNFGTVRMRKTGQGAECAGIALGTLGRAAGAGWNKAS